MSRVKTKKKAESLPPKRGRKSSSHRPKNVYDSKARQDELELRNFCLAKSQLELELSREKYVDLYDSAPVSFVTLDHAGMIREINLPAASLFNQSRGQLPGCPFLSFIARNDRKKFLSHLHNCRKNSEKTKPLSVELELTVKGRETPVFIELISLPSTGKFPETGLFKSIFLDITERKRNELELKRARDEAEHANRAKDHFLATLSHELRTPLNPVLLMASDCVDDRELPPRIRAVFDLIRRNIELESRLIDDLLDLTSISRGKLSLNKQPLHASDVLLETISTLRSDLEQKQLRVEKKFTATNDVIQGDTVRLQQILWNIIRNAIKFTPAGGTIHIETVNTPANELNITVTDTGLGMTAHEIAHIFEAFAQGDHAIGRATQKFGGLGIGLAICQRLMEAHDGTIAATSDGRNKGSSFTVRFPLADCAVQSPIESSITSSLIASAKTLPKGARILLVEDHEATRNALTVLLLRRNYKVQSAASLKEARHALDGNRFDLLISDIGLPDGTGNDLMRGLGPHHLPGIALTGYGMEEDIRRSYDAGFAAHLTKPVRIDSLEAALIAAVRSSAAAS